MDLTVRYAYDPIQPDQLRLCQFVQDGDYLVAIFKCFPADGPHPPYSALSYTWGLSSHMAESWPLQIGQRYLPVLPSLWPFVQALRLREHLLDGTWWWIDSICIDQTNLQERSQHVRRMKHTYQNAHKVVVWLGEQSEDSDSALDFIGLLDEMNNAKYSRESLHKILHQDEYCDRWIAFRNFFMRKWWTRVWTIQEFAIPSNILFWCGQRYISRDAIFAALGVADRCSAPNFKETIAFHHAFNRRRVWLLYEVAKTQEKRVNLSLLALAAYFCSNEATDDRDRLYGFTGLCTEDHGLEINYAWSVNKVYLHFAKSFIAEHKSLDILCFASMFKATARSSLPSWVPDWRIRIQPTVIPLMASQSSCEVIGNLRPPRTLDLGNRSTSYLASGSKVPVYSFEGSSLLVRGGAIDKVADLAGAQEYGTTQGSTQESTISHTATEILVSVCRCLVLDRGDRYLSHPMPGELFYHDFINLCLLMSTSRHLVQSEFQEWYDSIAHLRFYGSTFEEVVHAAQHESKASLPTSAPVQDEYIQDSLYGRFFDVVQRSRLRLTVCRSGRIGMVPPKAIRSDLICILYGCSVPLLLRGGEQDDETTVVGECFLDGCMKGEALSQCEAEERTFRIV
ncbi:hypothetical protein EKO04_003823 [Ascochyta lentis]|uniref:Heterokaryon incompatibility domain-containing protein n=1 Tax=Ascochyta lentis TaxID=205686 RepID=A0A8H7J8E4_9PLEO|nr:hypothetical protein EKO04_003823 [Ascochyta lentis]